MRSELEKKFGPKQEIQSSVADDLYDQPVARQKIMPMKQGKTKMQTKTKIKDNLGRSVSSGSKNNNNNNNNDSNEEEQEEEEEEDFGDDEFEEAYYDELESAMLESELMSANLENQMRIRKNYGLMIRKWRESKSLSRQNLGVRIQVLERTIEAWENGDIICPDKYAKLLKLKTFQEFFNFNENK